MGAGKDLIILYRQEAHSSRSLAIYQIALAHFLPSLAISYSPLLYMVVCDIKAQKFIREQFV